MNTVTLNQNTTSLTNTFNSTLDVDNTRELMSSWDIHEKILPHYRHDNLKIKIEELVSKGIFSEPEIQVIKKLNSRNQKRSLAVYMLDERSSHILVAHIDPKRTAQLYDAWNALRQENEELKNQITNPFANMSKLDWMKTAVELEEQNCQLINLHVRKSIDAHSMSRLLGVSKSSLKTRKALSALCKAGYIVRRLDEYGKPHGYDLCEAGYMFGRMTHTGQLEFTVDVLPLLVKLGVLEPEEKESLRLPSPCNFKAIVKKSATKIRQNTASLSLVGFDI